jgi:hypothetical protein
MLFAARAVHYSYSLPFNSDRRYVLDVSVVSQISVQGCESRNIFIC